MLGHAARLLANGPWKGSDYVWDRTTYFALLESFLMHTRSLMAFIHPTGRGGQDDLHARDFIPGWRPPAKWSTFDRDRDRISQEISHLSFRRPTSTSGWNYGQLVGNLNVMLRAFIDDVDPGHVLADFKAQATAALADPLAHWTSTPTQTFQDATRLVERD